MTAVIIALAAAIAAAPPGPGLRRAGHDAQGDAVVESLDHRGQIVARIACLKSQWTHVDDLATRVMMDPEVAAAVLAHDGRLDAIEPLGDERYQCVIVRP